MKGSASKKSRRDDTSSSYTGEEATKFFGPDLLTIIVESLITRYAPLNSIEEIARSMPKGGNETEMDMKKRRIKEREERIAEARRRGNDFPFRLLLKDISNLRLTSKLVKEVVDQDRVWLVVIQRFFGASTGEAFKSAAKEVSDFRDVSAEDVGGEEGGHKWYLANMVATLKTKIDDCVDFVGRQHVRKTEQDHADEEEEAEDDYNFHMRGKKRSRSLMEKKETKRPKLIAWDVNWFAFERCGVKLEGFVQFYGSDWLAIPLPLTKEHLDQVSTEIAQHLIDNSPNSDALQEAKEDENECLELARSLLNFTEGSVLWTEIQWPELEIDDIKHYDGEIEGVCLFLPHVSGYGQVPKWTDVEVVAFCSFSSDGSLYVAPACGTDEDEEEKEEEDSDADSGEEEDDDY